MIDIEAEVFTNVAKVLRAKFEGIFVASDEMVSTPRFPAVKLQEINNRLDVKAQSSLVEEQFSKLTYEVEVFTNDKVGRKQKAKEIVKEIDVVMFNLGFRRTMCQPLPNLFDESVARRVARYEATVRYDRVMFRR